MVLALTATGGLSVLAGGPKKVQGLEVNPQAIFNGFAGYGVGL